MGCKQNVFNDLSYYWNNQMPNVLYHWSQYKWIGNDNMKSYIIDDNIRILLLM